VVTLIKLILAALSDHKYCDLYTVKPYDYSVLDCLHNIGAVISLLWNMLEIIIQNILITMTFPVLAVDSFSLCVSS